MMMSNLVCHDTICQKQEEKEREKEKAERSAK